MSDCDIRIGAVGGGAYNARRMVQMYKQGRDGDDLSLLCLPPAAPPIDQRKELDLDKFIPISIRPRFYSTLIMGDGRKPA